MMVEQEMVVEVHKEAVVEAEPVEQVQLELLVVMVVQAQLLQ
jgi:hypothetical protein